MAKVSVLYWREIPSVVQAADGTETVKIQLSERFQALIDAVAMRLGMAGTDDYLEQWEHGDEHDVPGSAREAAAATAEELESRFTEYRDRGLGRDGAAAS